MVAELISDSPELICCSSDTIVGILQSLSMKCSIDSKTSLVL